MSENATADLVNEAVAEKKPPGPNADRIMSEAAANTESAGGDQMNLPGVPAPAPALDMTGYDPAIHVSPPVKTTDGKWRLKSGRKPARDNKGHFVPAAGTPAPSSARAVDGDALYNAPATAAVGGGAAPQAPADKPPLTEEMARTTAEMYVDGGIAVAQGIFGDEWKPDEAAEREALVKSTAAYLYATQSNVLSPGMMLVIGVGMYSAKRVQRPNTLQKIKIYVMLIRTWIFGR